MANTMLATMPNYPRETRQRLARWLGYHLPLARKRALGVTQAQAAMGADGVPGIGVGPRTVGRLESLAERDRRKPTSITFPATQDAQIERMLDWVRRWLGYGPSECEARPCEVCPPKPERGVTMRKERG